jgi:Phosphatidylinositol-glycan biosynthesis class S protein
MRLSVLFIINIIADYLQPFLDELSSVSNFSVKSQVLNFFMKWTLKIHPSLLLKVLYFASLGVRKKAVNTKELGPHHAIQEELLPQVISPLEKKIGAY